MENKPDDYVYIKVDYLKYTGMGAVFFFGLDRLMYALIYTKMRDHWAKR